MRIHSGDEPKMLDLNLQISVQAEFMPFIASTTVSDDEFHLSAKRPARSVVQINGIVAQDHGLTRAEKLWLSWVDATRGSEILQLR